jgi:hypothetical protein
MYTPAHALYKAPPKASGPFERALRRETLLYVAPSQCVRPATVVMRASPVRYLSGAGLDVWAAAPAGVPRAQVPHCRDPAPGTLGGGGWGPVEELE